MLHPPSSIKLTRSHVEGIWSLCSGSHGFFPVLGCRLFILNKILHMNFTSVPSEWKHSIFLQKQFAPKKWIFILKETAKKFKVWQMVAFRQSNYGVLLNLIKMNASFVRLTWIFPQTTSFFLAQPNILFLWCLFTAKRRNRDKHRVMYLLFLGYLSKNGVYKDALFSCYVNIVSVYVISIANTGF